ncbi:MAG: flagellar hook-length control protein FliK [Gammaproteobacteria bacterium]|nr:flagellar hook-length control protein FliK [Gammaproteobacteria bacterium]
MVMDRNGKLVGSPLHGTGAFMVAEAIPDHSVKPEIVSWASTSPDLARSDQGATLNSSITHKLSSESVLSTGDFIRTDPVRNETPRVPEILPEQFKIPEEVAGRRWGEAVNSRITWMAGNSIQHAELRLNPPELGPLEVRISVNREDASIQFTALHPSVREALETALPRLRDMLQENGLNLAQVGVSGQGAGNDGREASDTATENRMENSGESSDLLEQELEKTPGGVRASRGLIDAYV